MMDICKLNINLHWQSAINYLKCAVAVIYLSTQIKLARVKIGGTILHHHTMPVLLLLLPAKLFQLMYYFAVAWPCSSNKKKTAIPEAIVVLNWFYSLIFTEKLCHSWLFSCRCPKVPRFQNSPFFCRNRRTVRECRRNSDCGRRRRCCRAACRGRVCR